MVNKQLIGQVIEQLIERLKKGGWYVVCKTEQDVYLLLLVCKKAGIKWIDGSEATDCKPPESCPFEIGLRYGNAGMAYVIGNSYEEDGLQNITDWFFNTIKNNDSKLIPQNEEQEHLVQMLLAKMQGIPIEYWSTVHYKWLDSKHDAITASAIYRIKPTLTQKHH